MVFYPPATTPSLPRVPDDIPICDFIFNDRYRGCQTIKSRNPFTDGVSGQTYSTQEVAQRVGALARALAFEFDWQPNHGSEWDKTVGIFSVNTIDYMTLCWAVHRCNGIPVPASASYGVPELSFPLREAKVKALFTNAINLPVALEAASTAGIPRNRIYLLESPSRSPHADQSQGFVTVDQLIEKGASLPSLERLNWTYGQAKRQVGFLCCSSGTSGFTKLVKVSHYNVIANTIQYRTASAANRAGNLRVSVWKDGREVALGLLPQSHIFALIVICHVGVDIGDETIILPKFDLEVLLAAIKNYKITTLSVVPPILIAFLKNRHLIDKSFDISSVHSILSGGAPLPNDLVRQFTAWWPHIRISQGYGMTETATVISSTQHADNYPGSCGNLLCGVEAKIINSSDGSEIFEYDKPGELVVRSPSVTVRGYYANDAASAETFTPDGWVRTGDEVVMRKSERGGEHLFVVDRIKELIKTKGHQIAPAELEGHLLAHPFVADCAVIGIRDDFAGEVPKAFVVKSAAARSVKPDPSAEANAGENSNNDAIVAAAIRDHVAHHLARHKALTGGIEFIDAVPKNASGKILRRLLRDRDGNSQGKKVARAKL